MEVLFKENQNILLKGPCGDLIFHNAFECFSCGFEMKSGLPKTI